MTNPQKKDGAIASTDNDADPFATDTVPVRKPNPQDWVRVHPGVNYRMEFAFIELKDDRELYLIHPNVAAAHLPLQYN